MTAGFAVDPPPARRVVHLLLGHALVDEARRALRLVLRVVPSAGPSQARAGAMGAGAEGDWVAGCRALTLRPNGTWARCA